MKLGYRLAIIASAITLLAVILINIAINAISADSSDQFSILEDSFGVIASVYLGILLVLLIIAAFAFLRRKKALGTAILFAILFSLLTIIAASSAFSSSHYLYIAASLLIGVISCHLLKWHICRNYFLVGLIVTITVVASTRIWMAFY